ncbi:MAG: DUF1836 domain-containing protein [Clostridia bacterium]|nr:DUF1836 domain-containing protein [Clostridia bacterium]
MGIAVIMEKTSDFYADAERLREFAREYREFEATSWDSLPDIELYMEQITGYLNRQLRVQTRQDREDSQVLTSSMVNNYVKSGLITRPIQKRYDREQLAQLYMLCSMKQILNIPDAAALIRYLTSKEHPISEVYDAFVSDQHDINEGVADVLEQVGGVKSEYDLLKIAVGLVLNAAAERLAAERIISLFRCREERDAEVE